jgi:hypothetical protein
MRLLMIHGYAQNDEIFRAKSRRFEACVHSAYPHAEFIWACGPLQLDPDDTAESSEDQESQEDESRIDFRAWFHQHVPGRSLQGLSKSLSYLADLLQRHGPFDGVVGFSQGSVMAVIFASLLQGDTRRNAYEKALPQRSGATLPYPPEFAHLAHPPLKFGILFCPGLLRIEGMEWLWDGPTLSTPFCRVVGRWDTVVSDIQRETVLEMTATKGSITVTHQGSHCLPTSDIFSKHLTSFFASIPGLEEEIVRRNAPLGNWKVIPGRNDSAHPTPGEPFKMDGKLSDSKTVLYLACTFRHEPLLPLDTPALKKLSTSGRILSVDPIAGGMLSTIRDGW